MSNPIFYPPVHPSKKMSRGSHSLQLDEQQPPSIDSYLSSSRRNTNSGLVNSCDHSQSSVKTVKTSNFASRIGRTRARAGTFPTIPADQPLQAPAAPLDAPEEVPRKGRAANSRMWHQSVQITPSPPTPQQRAVSTEVAAATQAVTPAPQQLRQSVSQPMIYTEQKQLASSPIREASQSMCPVSSSPPPASQPFQKTAPSPTPSSLSSYSNTPTLCQNSGLDTLAKNEVESFEEEDEMSTTGRRKRLSRRSAFYLFTLILVFTVLVIAIMFVPRNGKRSLPQQTLSPTPMMPNRGSNTPAPTPQSTVTLGRPSQDQISITTGSPISQAGIAPPISIPAPTGATAPPRPDLSKTPNSNGRPVFSQVGDDIPNSGAFSLADDGTVMAIGNRVYRLQGESWRLEHTFPEASVSNVDLSSDGKRVAVASTEHSAVYEDTAAKGDWTQLGTEILHLGGATVRLSMDGSILCVATASDNRIRAFQFLSGNWKKLGTTIDEELEQDKFSMSMSEDGRTVALGSWTKEQSATVYALSATNKWERKGKTLGIHNFFRRSVLTSRVSVSLDGDGSTLAFATTSSTKILLYAEDRGLWTETTKDLPGGSSVAISQNGALLVVGNPSPETLAIAYDLRDGEWEKNEFHLTGKNTDRKSVV